jgi:hypothetical protein
VAGDSRPIRPAFLSARNPPNAARSASSMTRRRARGGASSPTCGAREFHSDMQSKQRDERMTGLPAKVRAYWIWMWSIMTAVSIGLSALPAHAVEVDVDRPGLDYRNFDLNDATYYACQRACQLDARCRAWTYVKPGYQGPKPRCWLKSAEPGLRTAPCCHSGVKDDFSSSGMIRQVQSILAKYGYDPGPIDGKPGRQTIDFHSRRCRRPRPAPSRGCAGVRVGRRRARSSRRWGARPW